MVEEIAPLQSTLILDEGGGNSEPRRMPITSALYELGGPGTRQTTMRVISQGIWASQKLSGGSILDLSKLQDPRTLGYLLIFGLYSKPIAYC